MELLELLAHRVVEECITLFNSNSTYRKTQESKLIQELSLQCVEMQERYTALIDMGMIWRMVTPSAEDRHTQDGTPYKWSDYASKVGSIIVARHHHAERIICVNDPYDLTFSTKDDKRNIPKTYIKLSDPFPSARSFKTLLCSAGNKGRLQKLICSYLTATLHREIIYSVGSQCTNLTTQQPMSPHYSFDHSEADTVLFSIILCSYARVRLQWPCCH